MDSYEINKDTYAVMSVNEGISKILEKDDEYFVNKNSYEVMEDSCSYYGSSCEGRIKGTKQILGSNYKVPIVVEESFDVHDEDDIIRTEKWLRMEGFTE